MSVNNRLLTRHISRIRREVQQPTYPSWWATQWGIQHEVHQGFSYCITDCSHPEHVQRLIEELIENTTSPYEIVLWVCVEDYDFEKFIEEKKKQGIDIVVVDKKSPVNTNMPTLFPHCKRIWLMQIDDDIPKLGPHHNLKVSIVIPTFKRQHVILRTVKSILAQSYENWELIISNNEKDAQLILPRDKRIKIYEHSEEANACYARNKGLEHVTGDLVCFFDDDDEMMPGYMEKMAAPFSDPDVQVVRCGMLCTFGACDFSYSTQEAWLRTEHATPTWGKGSLVHDQVYYHTIIEKNGWKRNNIVQLGEVLVKAYTEPKGGIREGGY